jgi:Ca-activated chloride channel family protein
MDQEIGPVAGTKLFENNTFASPVKSGPQGRKKVVFPEPRSPSSFFERNKLMDSPVKEVGPRYHIAPNCWILLVYRLVRRVPQLWRFEKGDLYENFSNRRSYRDCLPGHLLRFQHATNLVRRGAGAPLSTQDDSSLPAGHLQFRNIEYIGANAPGARIHRLVVADEPLEYVHIAVILSTRRMTLRTRILILLTILLSGCLAYAAQKSLKVDIDLVMVSVGVRDSDNRAITDLKAENFQIFEDKVEQKIRYFSSEVAPISLGIIFDMSRSMQKKLPFARDAALKFLETGTPDDEYFLVEFSSRAELAQGFTTDITRLRDKLSLVPAQGNTALYDGVYLGLAQLKRGQNPRKALLLITDGEDNHSRYSRRDIREFVRESDAQIFVIDMGRALVGELADMTGGHSYRASANDLEETCEKIAMELKSQYVIGYESTNTNKDGRFRKLRVKVNPPAGMSKFSAHARDGYYAPNTPTNTSVN